MAERASEGHYHDFLSPLALPAMQLARDLSEVGTPAALAILRRHVEDGEFDAGPDE